MRDQQNKEYYY